MASFASRCFCLVPRVVERRFEFIKPLFVVIKPTFLFEIDAEQSREEWILVVQESACVSVLSRVREELIEPGLVAVPEGTPEVVPPLSDCPQCITVG